MSAGGFAEHVTVDRPGGRVVHAWRRPGTTRPVLAVHGLSSTSRLWTWVLAAAPDLDLVAADLSGRGLSTPRPDTSTLAGHVADQVAVLDALGLHEPVDVVGMSLGGFVAVQLAAAAPGRVRSLTLLDGGLPMARRPTSREQLAAAFADRTARLDTDWPDLAAYTAFVVGQTAPLLDPADPHLATCLAHDLERGRDGGRVRLDGRALVDDAADTFLTGTAADALARLSVPARLLHAEWSTGAGSLPAYTAGEVAGAVAASGGLLAAEPLPGHDHAGVVMSDSGAAASVAVLRRSLA
ncbi:Pimeloyl-ACP methyl ester carboxylesterase [Geodermatophilus telluris]|uniref:Pimeloyl-ACP methyl ester carboxylesterase n=1 Tax=Geodermatophilus telluris TaxID=1190417 RepID=A0A1G6QFR1_9ACTN|nr:alpha/beta hydrolase [Geodermatophilus telluris]SDC91229.1 Pimeloyl-ACP methyl ester carboxylesterase [Geodermatophilus telluris]